MRVPGAECFNGDGIEPVRVDLALNRVHPVTSVPHYKIHLAARSILPVKYVFISVLTAQGIQHQVFPQQATIILSDVVPALFKSNKPGIEGITLGTADHLAFAAAMKRGQQEHRVSNLQGFEV